METKTKHKNSPPFAPAGGSADSQRDLEALRLCERARGEISEALHEICLWNLDLTLTLLTTAPPWIANRDLWQRAYKAHRVMLQYREKYTLRSRAEVERGERDTALDQSSSPEWQDAFRPPNSDSTTSR